MHDAGSVGDLEGDRCFANDVDDLRRWKWTPLGDRRFQALPLEKFHDDVRQAARGDAVVVHLHHVAGLELGGRLRFGFEPTHRISVLGELGVDELDRHAVSERRVPGSPNRSHRAATDELLDAVLAGDDGVGEIGDRVGRGRVHVASGR